MSIKSLQVSHLCETPCPMGVSQGENRDSPPGSPSANSFRAGDINEAPKQFLTHLKMKAGLTSDYWSNTLKVERYTVESIQ
jgi:hypothetical protein